MDFFTISSEFAAELAAIPDEQPEAPAGSAPRLRDFHDEDQWFRSFDEWAEKDKSLVDSLDANDLDGITQAVSRIDLKSVFEAAQLALEDSRWNMVAVEHLDRMLSILATERDTISEHLNRYLADWVTSSPALIDEYALMSISAKKTTTDLYLIASTMTWYDWPTGFNHLLRINALHTRTTRDLNFRRSLCLENRLPLSQNLTYPTHLLDPLCVPPEYGYEHHPSPNGFADFRPPTTDLEGSAAHAYITHSISLRDTRRRTAMLRLANGTAGVSDFLIPNQADMWIHGAIAWLSNVIPKLRSVSALKWAQVLSDLNVYTEKWHKEAGYENNRVLRERYATYRLTADRMVTFEYNDGDPVPEFVTRVISLAHNE